MLDFVKMTYEEFAAYKEKSVDQYADALSNNMRINKEAALDMSKKEFDFLLSKDNNTEGQYFFNVFDNIKNEKIGILWLNINPKERQAFIYDIEIDKQYRGKGYGKLTLEKVDKYVREKDIDFIYLSVFGDNETAFNLYKKMGYSIVNRRMVKELSKG